MLPYTSVFCVLNKLIAANYLGLIADLCWSNIETDFGRRTLVRQLKLENPCKQRLRSWHLLLLYPVLKRFLANIHEDFAA